MTDLKGAPLHPLGSDVSDLIALAERVAATTGADRRLEEEIARAFGWREEEYNEIGEEPGTMWVQPNGLRNMLPTFFSSLDAAMTLVPKGAQLQFQSFGGPGPMWLVSPNERYVSGATPALALVAACLRARAA